MELNEPDVKKCENSCLGYSQFVFMSTVSMTYF